MLPVNNYTRIWFAFLAAGVVLGWSSKPAYADFVYIIQGSSSQTSDNLTKYTYTVNVGIDSDYSFGVLRIAVPESASLSNISVPQGWKQLNYVSGNESISWVATDQSYFTTAGSSITFSFTSPLLPGNDTYTVFGYADDPSDFTRDDGELTGPASSVTPEPSSFFSLGIALVTLTVLMLFAKNRLRSRCAT